MIARLRRWHVKPDPLGLPRNPLAVYLLAIAFVSGVSQVVGVTTTQSIEEHLPPLPQVAWGLMLAIGSLASLAGMFWQGDRRTGLVVKRFGYACLTLAALVYGAVLTAYSGLGAGMVVAFVLGFAVACAQSWRVVNRAIGAIVKASQ